MITFEQVGKSFDNGASWAVKDVSLTVEEGTTTVLLGSSGCGKSTLLRMLIRLLEPTQGRILLDGQDIATLERVNLRRRIGCVFQHGGVFPHMTVGDNIGLLLKLEGMQADERRVRVEQLLALCGLPPGEYYERYPHALSGGQRQRVAVARALSLQPGYLLMDEPFGALDAITRRQMQEELKNLRRDMQVTVLFVTHDVFEAFALGDRIAVMDAGRIAQCADAATLLRAPANDFVEALVARPVRDMQQLSEQITG